jgi:hypothetical protein
VTLRITVLLEVDFKALREAPCELCGRPFYAHFQPPPDADKRLAANWCPDVISKGRWMSRSYRRGKGVRK